MDRWAGKSVRGAIWAMVSTVCALVTLSACSWESELAVDAQVLSEVREVGTVLLDTESRFNESNTVIVTRHLIIDMGSTTARTALEQASSKLRDIGWSMAADRPRAWVQMTSSHWENTLLTVETAEFSLAGGPIPGVSAWLKTGSNAKDSDALIVVHLRRMDA